MTLIYRQPRLEFARFDLLDAFLIRSFLADNCRHFSTDADWELNFHLLSIDANHIESSNAPLLCTALPANLAVDLPALDSSGFQNTSSQRGMTLSDEMTLSNGMTLSDGMTLSNNDVSLLRSGSERRNWSGRISVDMYASAICEIHVICRYVTLAKKYWTYETAKTKILRFSLISSFQLWIPIR